MRPLILFVITGVVCLMGQLAASAQATIMVKNAYRPEEISKQAQYYAQSLGLDHDVHIIINFSQQLSPGVSGFTRYRGGPSGSGGHQICIIISKSVVRSHRMVTLAHEMVHARQFVEGDLVKCDPQHYSWKQDPCRAVRDIAYFKRPWEKEAQKMSVQLYKAYQKEQLLLAQN